MKYYILSIVLVVFTAQNTHSQTYDSSFYVYPGIQGNAKFNYFINKNNEVVKDGDFLFESTSTDKKEKNTFKHVLWTGQFLNDKKNGKWEYITTTHHLNLVSVEDTFDLNFNTSTIKQHIIGHFKNNTPHGQWTISTKKYANKKLVEELQKASFYIQDAKITGDFSAFGLDSLGYQYKIEGTATDGLMNKQWSFSYFNNESHSYIKEWRTYNSGFLLDLIQTNEKTQDTLIALEFPLSVKIHEFLKKDEQDIYTANTPLSLTFNDGYSRKSIFIDKQQAGNNILNKLIKTSFLYEEDYFENHGLPIGTNRMMYPLSNEEKKILKSWPDLEFNFRKKVNSLEYLHDINFKYAENDSLQLIETWVKKQNALLQYIKPWNDIFSLNELPFYNREGLLYDYAHQLLNKDTVCFEPNINCITYEVDKNSKKNFLFYVSENLQERTLIADSLIKAYKRIITKLQLESNVLLLKEKISIELDSLNHLYQSPRGKEQEVNLINYVKEKYIDGHLPQEINQFISKSESPKLQQQLGDSILFKLNLIHSVYYDIKNVFYESQQVDSLYTEYVFDPYTFNDKFPKRIKKRLYDASVDIFNTLLTEARNSSSLIQLKDILKIINKLHQRMIFLVDKDTKKIERKLKKNTPLEEKLEILKIE